MVRIDQEFENLIPPLTSEEFDQLADSIRIEGCRDPLVVWQGTDILLDGHHRYRICQQFDIPFDIKELKFETREDAKIWIIKNQFGRRNITPMVRGELALTLKSVLAEKAKVNMALGGGDKVSEEARAGLTKLSNPVDRINTREEIARVAGISEGTISKVEKIKERGSEELKEAARKGEVSINAAAEIALMPKEWQAKLLSNDRLTIPKIAKELKVERTAMRAEQTRSNKSPILKSTYDVEIRHGDFRDVLTDIPDHSADVILTDPPYGKEYLPLWNDLGEFAARVLKPSGVLVAYSGQLYLPEVIASLGKRLTWWWLGAVVHGGTTALTPLGYPVRKVINQFKPILVYIPRDGSGVSGVFKDLIIGCGEDKNKHNWQQPLGEAIELLKTFAPSGGLVVDPMAGSGTVGQAAKELGMSFIGAEVENAVED